MRGLGLLGAAGLLLAGGLWQLGSAGWTTGKALLAQVLMERAWTATLESGEPVRPWPWADTRPAARLVVPAHDQSLFVLDEANLRNLAFGPARLSGGGRPGGPGVTVLAGHRDSHFRFLGDLAPGEQLRLQLPDGTWHDYRVVDMAVLDQPSLSLPPDAKGLALVTCWPLDALLPGGEQRYVVLAEPVGLSQTELAGRF